MLPMELLFNGTLKIKLYFENKVVMEATQKLFKEQGIEGIDLIHTARKIE